MPLEIPIRGVESLPDPIQVWFSIRGPRRTVRSGLRMAQRPGQQEDDCCRDCCNDRVAEPTSHRTGPGFQLRSEPSSETELQHARLIDEARVRNRQPVARVAL